jgi:hypothetical protein
MSTIKPGQLVCFTRDTILLPNVSVVKPRPPAYSSTRYPHLSSSDYAILLEGAELWMGREGTKREVLTKFGVGYVDEGHLQVA